MTLLPGAKSPLADYEKQLSPLDEKQSFKLDEIESESTRNSESNFAVLDSERDIATNIIDIHDDPNLNPWTLRAFVIGLGLSAFGGVLGTEVVFLRLPSTANLNI